MRLCVAGLVADTGGVLTYVRLCVAGLVADTSGVTVTQHDTFQHNVCGACAHDIYLFLATFPFI